MQKWRRLVFLVGLAVVNCGGESDSVDPIAPGEPLPGRIVFADTSGAIKVMNADGSGTVDLVLNGMAPTWSPDGSRVAYVSAGNLIWANADGSGARPLVGRAGAFVEDPDWSYDGQRIAFAQKATDGTDGIYVINVDGAGLTQVVDTIPDRQPNGPSWSPDGTKIAFWGSTGLDGNDVLVVNADGTGITNLTSDRGRGFEPAWSPDGQFIAFMGGCDLDFGLMLIRPDGTDCRMIASVLGGIRLSPSWSPDGAWLAYIEPIDGFDSSAIFAVKPDGTGRRRVGGEGAQWLDWGP